VIDKRVNIYRLDKFIQIDDRCDAANLELDEKSGTGFSWCNSEFVSIVAGGFLPHFSDTLSGRSVSCTRHYCM